MPASRIICDTIDRIREDKKAAPKTDTPAMLDGPSIEFTEHGFTIHADTRFGHIRKRVLELSKQSAERRGLKSPDVNCVYTAAVHLAAELESTLAAERASRVQADTEQFNAGIAKALATCCEQYDAKRAEFEYNIGVHACENAVRRLPKPSVSPEQEKP